MIDEHPISQLAQSLRRLRDGEDSTPEVVRWLRACSDAASRVPMPPLRNRHRNYTRSLLYRNDAFEIVVLHWMPNSTTAIHDHGGARCWQAVACGGMRVQNYLRTDRGEFTGRASMRLEGVQHLEAGGIDYREDDAHLHRCLAGVHATISLHVYARPIDRFRSFDERAGTCVETASSYDAVLT